MSLIMARHNEHKHEHIPKLKNWQGVGSREEREAVHVSVEPQLEEAWSRGELALLRSVVVSEF